MADAVVTRTILDGERKYIIDIHNTSDGTGEAGVTKVDVSALANSQNGDACAQVRVQRITGSTHGMAVELLWDADTNITAWSIPQDRADISLDFRPTGGLKNPETTGYNGDLLLTTIGHTNLDRYSLRLECTKEYA